MVFRKVYIVLCAALLAAGDLCAQQVRVEPRIAGLEGNREYMSLLEQDAQLQIREDSIVNAVERARQQLREDPANRQRYSQEILQLESRIFEVRNAKGRLIDKINTIEQEWVLANLNGAAQQPAEPAAESPAGAIPDSLKVRNLVFNPYFREQLPEADYAALRRAQGLELDAVDYVNRYLPTTGRSANWPRPMPRRRPRRMRARFTTATIRCRASTACWPIRSPRHGIISPTTRVCLWLSDGQTGAGCHPGA